LYAKKIASGQWSRQTAENMQKYAEQITVPVNSLEGDLLPVSAFTPGGRVPLGTTSVEKRTIALKIPKVSMTKCTQCNYCSFVCPHAAIRPFLLTNDEVNGSPDGIKSEASPAQGGGALDKYKYKIQVSPMDCTGCELCSRICPSDAIHMVPIEETLEGEKQNWDYAVTLPNRGDELDCTSVKGSQFQQPLLEFSGACEGCGETPYVKLLTQLVGDRLVIANATGCSSIWGGSSPSVPYTTNQRGEGPAWANSLFEDNAEFGFGLRRGYMQRREQFVLMVDDALHDPSVQMSAELRDLMQRFADLRHSRRHDMLLGKGRSIFLEIYHGISPLLEKEKANHKKLELLYEQRDLFSRFSHWIIGGDGWAYDIGFGGLDHVLASEEHVKIMVLDTEMYSNTGGQASKSTPTGASAKFAEPGKSVKKKDLGQYAMTYRNVYVASLCLEANHKQAVKAILEAESYPGPAILLCYSPCISQGFPMSQSIDHCRAAVDSGYWPLYRFNPQLKESGNNPFQLDSRTIRGDLFKFLSSENRFAAVQRSDPIRAGELNAKLQKQLSERQSVLKSMESGPTNTETKASESSVVILYGSETGNAEDVAKSLDADFKARGVGSEVWAMNDFDFERLPNTSNLVVVCSTCGLGEFPANSRALWKHLSNPELGITYLSKVKFAVFGLGDSHYTQYCAAAAAFDVRLEELGAARTIVRGYGDDQAEEKYFSGWDQWVPQLWKALDAPSEPIIKTKPKPLFTVEVRPGGAQQAVHDSKVMPPNGVRVQRTCAQLLTPEKYDRDIRHYEFNIEGTNLQYSCGDSLAIYPETSPSDIQRFCDLFKFNPTDELLVVPVGDYHSTIPSEMNVRQLVGMVLNITAPPTRRFFAALAHYAANPSEKQELESLGSESDPRGQQLRREISDGMLSILDVFTRYTSCRPSIAELIPIIPRIKPRLYSISSSPLAYPKSIHTTIVEVSWNTKVDGKTEERFGLSTSYLKRQPPQSTFVVQVMKSAIVLPKDPRTPVIMVGMGTGIAPWRALSQQKAFEKSHGIAIGPVRLYFGARKESQEFLYREEFKAFEKEGVLTLRTAFSRDQAAKIYVQHRLEEDGSIIFDMMHNQNGHFYVCGSARQLPVDIYSAMQRILLRHGGEAVQTVADAEAMLASWKMHGRYTVEAFS
jgi:sulfite reductase alpha subunit-like flavoprotein/ferredoxin